MNFSKNLLQSHTYLQKHIKIQAETIMREAWEHEGSKDELNIVLHGLEQHFWKGTEAGRMGCYDFSGETWAGDGSANKGVMGAGSVRFQRPGRNLVVRVGREEEGVSSPRPELAAIARTLQATALEVDLVYLCDSETALNKVSRWRIGQAASTGAQSDLMDSTRWGWSCMLQLQGMDDWGKPATTTWAAEFLLRDGESREFLGSWINSSAVHEAKKRRAKQVITCSFPCGKWLHMIGARASPKCELCKRERTMNREIGVGNIS
jgi:hypothetical protein